MIDLKSLASAHNNFYRGNGHSRGAYDYVVVNDGIGPTVYDSNGAYVAQSDGNTDAILVNNLSGHVYVSCNLYPETTITVKTDMCIEFKYGTRIYPRTNIDVFYFKKASRLINPYVVTTGIGFTNTVYKFNGIESYDSNNHQGVQLIAARAVGNHGVGTGKGIHMVAASGHIYGVEIDARIDGYEYGCLQECTAVAAYINGNTIKIIGYDCVHFIMQTRTGGTGAYTNLDGNSFIFDYQWLSNSVDAIVLYGRQNTVYAMGRVWDVSTEHAVQFLSTSSYNCFVGGIRKDAIVDAGVGNVVFGMDHDTTIPRYKILTIPIDALSVDQWIFVADAAYELVSLETAFAVTSTGACNLDLKKSTTVQAPASGASMLTAVVALQATANTVYAGTPHGTAATRSIADGDMMSLTLSAAATGLAGCVVTILLKRV